MKLRECYDVVSRAGLRSCHNGRQLETTDGIVAVFSWVPERIMFRGDRSSSASQ
jgi:hypothetical protein